MVVLADSYVDWASMWKILAISVAAGAGLVMVYSIGLLALSASGYVRRGDHEASGRRNVAALVAAAICLLVVAAGVAYGISVIFDKS